MNEFLTKLAELMRSVDPDAAVVDGQLVVLGCTFSAWERSERYGRVVYGFCGGRFSRRADGSYDLKRAMQLLVQQLPAALKRAEEQKERAQRLKSIQDFVDMIRPGVKYVEYAWCEVLEGLYVRQSQEGCSVLVRLQDMVHMAAVVDALQEHGLVVPKK